MKKIDFYFDFLSPYSYLAWTWVRENSKNGKYDFHFYPISMASIIASYETKGPAQIEPKRNYLFREILRRTKLLNIPFTPPKELPFNSLYALRLSLSSVALLPDKQKEIIDAIYRAGWEKGLDIGSDDVLKEVLKSADLYSEELIQRMEDRAARAELKANNAKALSHGVFGVPTFIVDNELFWGHDSINHLELYLNDNDPIDHEKYESFLNLFKSRS